MPRVWRTGLPKVRARDRHPSVRQLRDLLAPTVSSLRKFRRWAPGDWRRIEDVNHGHECCACGSRRIRIFMPSHTDNPYVFECRGCGASESIS